MDWFDEFDDVWFVDGFVGPFLECCFVEFGEGFAGGQEFDHLRDGLVKGFSIASDGGQVRSTSPHRDLTRNNNVSSSSNFFSLLLKLALVEALAEHEELCGRSNVSGDVGDHSAAVDNSDKGDSHDIVGNSELNVVGEDGPTGSSECIDGVHELWKKVLAVATVCAEEQVDGVLVGALGDVVGKDSDDSSVNVVGVSKGRRDPVSGVEKVGHSDTVCFLYSL